MRVIPLSEIPQMSHQEVISCCRGTIKSLYKPKGGQTNAGKNWSVQDLELADNAGNVVKVKLWDVPELPQSAKGKSLTLTAHQSNKGLSSVYAWDDDYKGKVTRMVKVTAAAGVEVDGQAPVPSEHAGHGDTPPQRPDPAPQQRSSASTKLTPEQDAKENEKLVTRKLVQLTNALDRNLDAAVFLASRFNKKYAGKFEPMKTEDVRAIAMSLQIACEHAHVIDLMPTVLPKEVTK